MEIFALEHEAKLNSSQWIISFWFGKRSEPKCVGQATQNTRWWRRRIFGSTVSCCRCCCYCRRPRRTKSERKTQMTGHGNDACLISQIDIDPIPLQDFLIYFFDFFFLGRFACFVFRFFVGFVPRSLVPTVDFIISNIFSIFSQFLLAAVASFYLERICNKTRNMERIKSFLFFFASFSKHFRYAEEAQNENERNCFHACESQWPRVCHCVNEWNRKRAKENKQSKKKKGKKERKEKTNPEIVRSELCAICVAVAGRGRMEWNSFEMNYFVVSNGVFSLNWLLVNQVNCFDLCAARTNKYIDKCVCFWLHIGHFRSKNRHRSRQK